MISSNYKWKWRKLCVTKKPYNKTFQRIMLCGRLAKDPEIKFIGNGKAVCNFGLIVNDDNGGSDYIPCVAWEGKAKSIADNIKKGDLILCEGKIKSSSFEDNENKKQFMIQFQLTPQGELLFLEYNRPEKPEEQNDGPVAD